LAESKLSEMVQAFLREDDHPEWLFGLGVAFICGAAREKVLAALQLRKQNLEKHQQALAEEAANYKDKIPFNWYMLIEHTLKHIQLDLDWLNQLTTTVQKAERWTPEWHCEEHPEFRLQTEGEVR
jgi:hypothetical protein